MPTHIAIDWSGASVTCDRCGARDEMSLSARALMFVARAEHFAEVHAKCAGARP